MREFGVTRGRPIRRSGRRSAVTPVRTRRPTYVNAAVTLLTGGYPVGGSEVMLSPVQTTVQGTMADPADADQQIIANVLAGDRDAFATLIQRYSDPLYRHALGMTGSPDVAEDILQQSFIKAYHHLAEVRGRFDAWLFRIVANGCKDWLKNIRRTHVSHEEDDQPSSYATPDEDLDRSELRRDLDHSLAQLPSSLREAFVMKHVEGRSYEEMADLLGTTVGALKMRVHRAREALQALLEEKYA